MMHRCESCPGSAALMMSSVIWIGTLNSIIVNDKQQIMLHWLDLQQHLKNTRNQELLIGSINNLTRHSYLAKAQARYAKSKKESLSANKDMVLGNFTENYQYLIQDMIQSFHQSKEYCTLHPLVIYTTKMLMETSNIIPSILFQLTTHTTPVLFTRFRHYWWNS